MTPNSVSTVTSIEFVIKNNNCFLFEIISYKKETKGIFIFHTVFDITLAVDFVVGEDFYLSRILTACAFRKIKLLLKLFPKLEQKEVCVN